MCSIFLAFPVVYEACASRLCELRVNIDGSCKIRLMVRDIFQGVVEEAFLIQTFKDDGIYSCLSRFSFFAC